MRSGECHVAVFLSLETMRQTLPSCHSATPGVPLVTRHGGSGSHGVGHDREHAWLPSMTQRGPMAGPAVLHRSQGGPGNRVRVDHAKSFPTPVRTWVLLIGEQEHSRSQGARAGRHITESASPFKLQTGRPRPTVKEQQDHIATGSARPPGGVGSPACSACGTVVLAGSPHSFLGVQGLMEEEACVNVNFVFECGDVCGAMDV